MVVSLSVLGEACVLSFDTNHDPHLLTSATECEDSPLSSLQRSHSLLALEPFMTIKGVLPGYNLMKLFLANSNDRILFLFNTNVEGNKWQI